MSIYALKPRFQALLRPLAGFLFRCGVTANQVTVFACLVSVALGIFLILQPGFLLLLPLWLVVRMAFNAIDGMLAREFGQASALGAYLNELTDVVSDAALYAPFFMLPGSNPWLLGGVIFLAALSEMAGIVGRTRRYDGPMGKSDRALVFGLLGLLVGLGASLAPFYDWIWGALLVLLAVTIANRVRRGIAG